jgi:uncharacterized Tic20 family protein
MDEQNQTSQPTSSAGTQNPETSSDAKNMGMLCHLLGLFTSFLGPLVLWLIQKDKMSFVDYHGKEALNFQITVLIATIVAYFSVLCVIGIVLLPAVGIADLILSIMACVAASKGEYYKYPWTLRLIK